MIAESPDHRHRRSRLRRCLDNERGFDLFHGFLGDIMDSYLTHLRQGRKLMQNDPYSSLELYNLNDDPYEQRDLAATHGERVKELAAALRRHVQRGGSTPWQKPR